MKLSKNEITELKDMFLEAARIDSPSGDEGKMVSWVKKIIKPLKIDPIIDGKKNMFFRVSGKGEPLLLCAHLDTVQPCINKEPQFDGKTFCTNGRTILGADDIAGIATILSTLFYLKKHKVTHRPLEILFTTMEEVGGQGVKDFEFDQLKAKEGIVVDSIAPVGSFIMRSPSKYYFSIAARGKAAHGSMSSRGISAIKIMAELLHRLPIGEILPNTYLNVGKMRGGRAVNTVPDEMVLEGAIKLFAEGEIRTDTSDHHQETLDIVSKCIKKVEKNHPEGQVEFSHSLQRGGYYHEADHSFVKHLESAIKKSGLKPKHEESFGVSDANTINAIGIKALLLGTGTKGAHTTNETITLNDLQKITEILIHTVS